MGLALNEQMFDFVPVDKNDEMCAFFFWTLTYTLLRLFFSLSAHVCIDPLLCSLDRIIWAEPERPLNQYDELVRDLNT